MIFVNRQQTNYFYGSSCHHVKHGVGRCGGVVDKEDRINPGRATSGNGQASRCRLCYALQTTGADKRP